MKKAIIIISVVLAVVLIVTGAIGIVIYQKNKKEEEDKPEKVLEEYISLISNKEYEKMYELLDSESKEKISQEDFITRNKNIYEGIEANNINIELKEVSKEESTAKIPYNMSMDTVAGKVEFENQMELVKENKEYHIKWSSKLIFPNLEDTDKVRVHILESERGNIYDRNDIMIGGKGIVSSVGLVPGKMNEENEKDIEKIANLLGVSKESIQNKLSASYVKEDTFVPIKQINSKDTELENKLLEIKGIKITNEESRVYPYGEVTSHLLGYVQNITAEDLEKNKDKGYTSTSIIGRSGIEKIYEDKLRGRDGAEIYITDEDGLRKETIQKKELVNGEDIKLTIDINLQKKVYEQFKEDKSAQVVMDYETGELLALVSTPTFDSNDFVLGMSDIKWQELKNDENKPLYNRYQATWAPGSSFKPLIAGIGLTTNKINPEENFGNVGQEWQKDSSWGNYKVTTMTAYGDNVNLKNALIHSDNIYFAKAALNIGSEILEEQLKKIGFQKDLDFNLGAKSSQYSNSESIETEIQLADTGYGQGQVLVNPIHMASIYSAFMNKGNMITPYIEYKENAKATILVENAFSEDACKRINEALIQVVEQGTATAAKIPGLTIAGKTGTAEIKDSKDDKKGTEIGWFNSYIIDGKNKILMISMVEDVKDRDGSHYAAEKVKNVYESIK